MIEIIRVSTDNLLTKGILRVNKQLLGVTLELPWRQNERNISCIPTGQYRITKYDSAKFKRICLGLHDVHGRSYIAIHPGEDPSDTEGCILPGWYFHGNEALTCSAHTLNLMLKLIPDETTITITENY